MTVHPDSEYMYNCNVDLASPVCLDLIGHIGIAVPDVHVACKLFEEQGVSFVKKPDDGEIVRSICRIIITQCDTTG